MPWALSNVISGSPAVFTPYVESARFAALHRNYWWEHEREVRGTAARGVRLSAHTTPYPTKSDAIADQAQSDSGGNFGRLARTTILDAYVREMMNRLLCGVRAKHWLRFLQAIQEKRTEDEIRRALDAISGEIVASSAAPAEQSTLLVMIEQIRKLAGLVEA